MQPIVREQTEAHQERLCAPVRIHTHVCVGEWVCARMRVLGVARVHGRWRACLVGHRKTEVPRVKHRMRRYASAARVRNLRAVSATSPG
jgi:hypothetical protein